MTDNVVFLYRICCLNSNEVAANDESGLLENAIIPTKRLSSESEDSKVEGDTSNCKKIKIENET